MKKALTTLTRIVLVGVLTSSCHDDGMLIAERIPPEPAASTRALPPVTETELEKAAVKNLLLDNCGSCHAAAANRPPHSLPGAASRAGGDVIADIGDIDALVASGLIAPGLPEESTLLFLMATGQMPPEVSGQSRVSEKDLRRLEKFIVRLDPPTQREVLGILRRNCGSCHGEDRNSAEGDGADRDRADRDGALSAIDDIEDLAVLVATGLVVPGDRDQSQVYLSVLDGIMPPQGAPPMSNRDLARLGGFIDMMR